MRDGPPKLESIAQRRLPDVVAEQIVQAIRAGSFGRGDRLPSEAELARQLGVGRTSIREGLQRLEAFGMIEIRKGRGAFVRSPEGNDGQRTFAQWSAAHHFDVEELLEVRMSLESLAAALAALRATPAEIDDLEAIHLDYGHACRLQRLNEVVHTDARFHDRIIAISRNRLLLRMHQVLVAGQRLAEFRRRTLALPGAMERAGEDHAAILRAIRRGDPAAARRSMIDHLWVLAQEIHEAASALPSDANVPLSPVPRSAFGDQD